MFPWSIQSVWGVKLFDHLECDYNIIIARFLGPSTYVANRKETNITKWSRLQSAVTGYLTIYNRLNLPTIQTGRAGPKDFRAEGGRKF